MSRRNSNARVIVYIKSMLIPATKQAIQIADAPERFKAVRECLYNPSIGKLRAWADPWRRANGIMAK